MRLHANALVRHIATLEVRTKEIRDGVVRIQYLDQGRSSISAEKAEPTCIHAITRLFPNSIHCATFN